MLRINDGEKRGAYRESLHAEVAIPLRVVEEKIPAVNFKDCKEISVIFILALAVPVLGIITELIKNVLQAGRDRVNIIIRNEGNLGARIVLPRQSSPQYLE
jgi:hypothetical protein